MAHKTQIEPKLLKTLMRVAQNLERLRNEQGWTQDQTSENLKSDLRWYQRLESGKHVLSMRTLVRLSQVFKVDIAEFFKP